MNCHQLKNVLFASCLLMLSFTTQAQENDWAIFQLNDFPPNDTKVFVDRPTISGAAYSEKSESTLSASKYDRVLFIVSGTCSATVKAKKLDLRTGDVVFLKANDAIKFSGGVHIMFWTSKSTDTNHRSKTEQFTKKQIEKSRDSSENIWNSFIETTTMVTGLYMLPESQDGDGTLNHGFDEINYVVKGSAKFKMNDTVIDVEPGSVMWVKRGVDHNFYDLSEDFDVFILFETINMNH